MKLSLKFVALSAMAASALAAPIEVEKRESTSAILSACFIGLIFTGSWPGKCAAAVSVDIGLITGITLNQLSMDFTTSNAYAPTLSSSDLVASMISIPGITLPISSIRQDVLIADSNNQIGTFSSGWASSSVSGSSLKTTIPTSTFNVFSNSQAAFGTFISSIANEETYALTLKGSVDAKLNLGIFGTMTIPDIGFDANVPIAGLNGLKVIGYTYLLSTTFSTTGNIGLGVIVNLPNPSKLTLNLGDVSFSTASVDGFVGYSTIKGLTLAPGNNYVIATTTLDNKQPAANKIFSSIYTSNVTLTLTGYNATSSNAALNAGLASMVSQMTIPQAFAGAVMSQAPYKNWSIKVNSGVTDRTKVFTVTATFQSPYYGMPVEIVNLQDANKLSAAQTVGISSGNSQLFAFESTSAISVPGTGSTTASFNVALPATFGNKTLSKWQAFVDFANTNGYITVALTSLPIVVVDNDGVQRNADWGASATKIPTVNIKTGSDFASILDVIPNFA
ncbi:hypothetical protein BGX20_009532 [Mortierella sp. AD010]|nr:hypothetical protein BGX20_009532 [Mortierella sp. AD010]